MMEDTRYRSSYELCCRSVCADYSQSDFNGDSLPMVGTMYPKMYNESISI